MLPANPAPRIRADLPGLIAHLWYSVGYRPRNAMVLAGLIDRVIGPVVRVDLPTERERAAVVRACLAPLDGAGATGVVALVLCDGERRTARALDRAVRRQAARRGLEVLDVLHIEETTYRSVACVDQRCCPKPGRPLAEVFASEVAVHHVLQGDVLAESEADLVADVEPVLPDETTPETTPETILPPAGAAGGHDSTGPRTRADWMDVWRRRFAAGAGWDGLAARFAAALRDVHLRDAVLADLAGDAEAVDLLLAEQAGPSEIFRRLPDRDRLGRGRELLAEAARLAPPGDRADALSALAFLAWYGGDGGARARLLTQRALHDRPGHRFAVLVDELLLAAVPPDWYRDRARALAVSTPDTGADTGCPRTER